MAKESLLRLAQYGISVVPAGWTQSRVKYLGAYVNGFPFKPEDWGTAGRPILRIQDLSSSDQEPNRFDGEIPGRYLVRPGDILISWSASLGVYRWAGEEAWLNQHIFKVELDPMRVRNDFFFWLAEWFINEMDRDVHGSTMQHLTADAFGGFPVFLPSQPDQARIARYLDRETSRLDALVAAKERVLALVAEKRRALITRAVTRGLDPGVPLRDSGIPWLGEIPAHWEIKRLKHVGRAVIGLTFDPADTVTDGRGVLVLRASNVRDQQIVIDDNVFVLTHIPEILRTKVGDILICSRSGSRSLIGKNALIDHTSAGVTFGAFMTVFRSPHNNYLFYIFNSPLFDYQAGAFATSTINQLTLETLNGMEVPLPPQSEQEAIVARLRDKTYQLDRLAEATERTISLLKERRAALIAAAVTGQIDIGSAA